MIVSWGARFGQWLETHRIACNRNEHVQQDQYNQKCIQDHQEQ